MAVNRLVGQATGKELHALFMEVFTLHDALTGIMDEAHLQAGLSTPQARLLRLLEEGGSLPVPRMAERLRVSRQFAQKTCNELLASGLIERLENPQHKRSDLFCITEQGRAARAIFKQREAELVEKLLPGVDAAMVRSAATLLHDLEQTVQKSNAARRR